MFHKRKRSSSHRKHHFILILSVVIVALAILMYTRPLPALYPINDVKAVTAASNVSLAWPAIGEAAIGATNYGVLTTNGTQTMRPTASTAKLITALTVLKRYPLPLGQQGPTITLNGADVAIYNKYAAENGSVAKVVAGEEISEYQMFQAMLLPSANNMADSLATWAFGSLSEYSVAAKQLVSSLGLTNTKVGSDASGFLPDTVSTAHDLMLLGQATMQNPVLAQIVNQTKATLPIAGVVTNVNWMIGEDGVIGIKTGNTDQAGGVYIFASQYLLDKTHSVTIIGTIQGVPTLQDSMNDAIPLLDSAKQNFNLSTPVKASQTVAHYDVPWSNAVNAIATKNVSVVTWAASTPQLIPALHAIYAPENTGAQVGTLSTVLYGSTTENVVLQHAIHAPPWWWRIIRHKL